VKGAWVNEYIPGAFAPNPAFVNYKVDGSNYGVVLRVNDMLAFAMNRAQSFRISAGEGADLFTPGKKQEIQTGEGQDASIRLSLFGGRMEINTTYYDNFQPNARIAPAPAIAIRDEVSAIFPTTFNPTGQDYQHLRTSGYELELVGNLTRYWRLILNGATNKLVTENRLPLLKGFQAEAKALGRPTPLLDAHLLTFPEGVPNAGYTKTRANIFTRYEFSRGRLRGLYIGGGANWRQPTFRGNAVVVQGTPVVAVWSPPYTVATFLAGYRTKILQRTTTFALNIDNVFDKDYYLSATTTTGSWGAPRGYRFAMTTDF
jgi:outer membrane receptor for ferric coprogen and ferric-rhodotorulic acid